ncbi:hypothetical protein F5B19DRAFT_481062 [Rostrohypoxylon terebratum]|nr:hypothetical protein F5B19DRAFT_481062 [Rostrohypoxylon terebratum]
MMCIRFSLDTYIYWIRIAYTSLNSTSKFFATHFRSTIPESAMPIIDDIIQAIVDSFHSQSSKRDILQIPGPVVARNVVDTESVPRVNIHGRNDLGEGPCGVPQYNFDLCGKSLQSVTIESSSLGQGGKIPLIVTYYILASATYAVHRGSVRQCPAYLHGSLYRSFGKMPYE